MYEWAGVLLTWGPVGGCPSHLRSSGRVSSSPKVQRAGVHPTWGQVGGCPPHLKVKWAGVLLTWGPMGECPLHLRSSGRVSSSLLSAASDEYSLRVNESDLVRWRAFWMGKQQSGKFCFFFGEECDILLRWLLHVLRRQDSNPYTLTKNCSKLFIQLFSFPILINCLFFQTLLLSRIIVRSVAGLLYRILSFHPNYFVVWHI